MGIRRQWSLVAVATLACAGCSGPARAVDGEGPGGRITVNERPPGFPGDFTPAPPPGDPDAPPPDKLGLAYLQAVYPSLGEPWASFLETARLRLPPAHPLNDASLAARASLIIRPDGRLRSVALAQPSGNADFDEAVLEILREAAPYPAPPAELLSDDGELHLHWLFARDRRQAGLATAEVERVEWALPRAMAAFLERGQVTAAAQRLARALGDAVATEEQRQLAEALARRTIALALQSDEPGARAAAVTAAAQAAVPEARPALELVVTGGTQLDLRLGAIAALGRIGESDALLVELVRAATPATLDVATEALRALGPRGAEPLRGFVAELLQSGDPERRAVAVALAGEAPDPDTVARLAALASDGAVPRDVRRAACEALGAGATGAAANQAIAALRAGLAERDAAVRSGCARGLAIAAERHAVSDRLAYWKVVELLKKERDERARAAAALAAARLEPGRFEKELYLLRREQSPVVLAALAEGLAGVPGPAALARLRQLVEHDSPAVRLAAVGALIGRGGDEARALAAGRIADEDPAVRRAALPAAADAGALEPLLEAPAPELQAAAYRALTRLLGQAATAADLAERLAQSSDASARARFAGAWLAGR